MWILNFLPEFVIHLMLLIGIVGVVAGFVLGFIPFISKYKLPIQIISILILAVSLWLEGGISNENKWQLRVKEMEKKVAEAEAKSGKVNVQIVEKIVTQKEYIRIQGERVVEYIDREVKVYDNQCKIPDAAIKAHNMAALNEAPPIGAKQ
jgi:hypothetical protein